MEAAVRKDTGHHPGPFRIFQTINIAPMTTIQPRFRRRFESDFTPEVRSVNLGFYLTPDEAQQVKSEAEALKTSVSCLIRESLRKTRIL
ncbi:MAG: hypothetical protein EB075_15350 [Bacteroidetes bacterium]|nr:hypothetical protein [Bacteroidota bacterium]